MATQNMIMQHIVLDSVTSSHSTINELTGKQRSSSSRTRIYYAHHIT